METTGHFFFRRTPTSIDRIPSSNGDGVPRTKLQTNNNNNMADPNSLLKGMLGIGANKKDAKEYVLSFLPCVCECAVLLFIM